MTKYFFRGADGELLMAEAFTEAEARRLVMVARWGSHPDAVTPGAPNYQGRGLLRCGADGLPLI